MRIYWKVPCPFLWRSLTSLAIWLCLSQLDFFRPFIPKCHIETICNHRFWNVNFYRVCTVFHYAQHRCWRYYFEHTWGNMRLLGVPFTTKDVSRFLPQIYMQYHASTQELILYFLAVFSGFLSILIPFLTSCAPHPPCVPHLSVAFYVVKGNASPE